MILWKCFDYIHSYTYDHLTYDHQRQPFVIKLPQNISFILATIHILKHKLILVLQNILIPNYS
jgi:hypothetical protein